MRYKTIRLSSFGHSVKAQCPVIRPDNLHELQNLDAPFLPRGAGLSYNDSSMSANYVVDTSRFTHFSQYDKANGLVVCEGHVTFDELLHLDNDRIPPVMPGTRFATLAGGIAHDVHGKNNHFEGALGQHVQWLDLLTPKGLLRCSPDQHPDLFHATIAGAGLTGFIYRLALQLKSAPRMLEVKHHSFDSLAHLLAFMSLEGLNASYQVAWIDLLNMEPRGIVSTADYKNAPLQPDSTSHRLPRLPLRLVNRQTMTCFNALYYKRKPKTEVTTLAQYNNPLDAIKNWDALYGRKGLVQFQAVFGQGQALKNITHMLHIIRRHGATPALCVLKLFIRPGIGLLSFCEPGFTIAIDFVNNAQAKAALLELNEYLIEIKGRVYLAKDTLLTQEQFQIMYPTHQQFREILADYQCNTRSMMSQRLGLTPS